MKLLAKGAGGLLSDRHQRGGDLRRCLGEWEAICNIARFQLGTRDIPDVLTCRD